MNYNQNRAFVVSLTVLTLALQACALDTNGNEGNFRFRETTPNPSISGTLQHPLAVGASLELEVWTSHSNSGQRQAIVEATSSDENVVEIVGFGLEHVQIRGVGSGVATVEVVDAGGSKDSIDVEVDEIHTAEIKLVPWVESIALPDALWSEGLVLLPGAPVRVFVETRSEGGEVLTGFGAADWQLVQGSPATLSREGGDSATLRAMSDTTGVVELRFGEWDSMAFEVLGDDAVERVGVYSQTGDVLSQDGQPLTLESGRTHLMHVTAFTADGRYVIGAGPEAIQPGTDEAAPFEITLDVEMASDPDLERVLANGRAFFLQTTAFGADTLTVQWLGRKHTFEIQVR